MRNSSAIIVEQNLTRFVPGCISLGHIQPRLYPVGTHAVLLLLLRSIGSPGRLKATEPDRMKSGRAHGYHYLDKTERGWPLSRSSLCILPLFPFSIGNLFRTSRVRTILVTGASLGSTRTLLIVGVIAVTAKEGHRLLDHLVPLTILYTSLFAVFYYDAPCVQGKPRTMFAEALYPVRWAMVIDICVYFVTEIVLLGFLSGREKKKGEEIFYSLKYA